jgi:hypothetical protein
VFFWRHPNPGGGRRGRIRAGTLGWVAAVVATLRAFSGARCTSARGPAPEDVTQRLLRTARARFLIDETTASCYPESAAPWPLLKYTSGGITIPKGSFLSRGDYSPGLRKGGS